jgi:hypothetical protein
MNKEVVVESAEPVLGMQVVPDGFSKYVKHWVVSGYSWDGDCMCTKEVFTNVKVALHSLKVYNVAIISELRNIL